MTYTPLGDGGGSQASATAPACGNGIVDPGEACDDGNTVDGTEQNGVFVLDHCSHDCLSTQVCGNGIVDRGEECDQGPSNGQADSGCSATCQVVDSLCGNGIVDTASGEQCDPGQTDSATCNSPAAGPAFECKIAKCGDGYDNRAAGEICDTGGFDTTTCNGKLCTAVACGDGYLNTTAGEQCESGGRDTSTCNGLNAGALACHLPACGDGYVNTSFTPPGGSKPEQCDNAGGGDTTTCNGNDAGSNGPGSCRVPACGDGYVNTATGEQCDPIGGADSANCNGTNAKALQCKLAACGDGYVNRQFTPPGAVNPESCDNGPSDTVSCNGNNQGRNGPGSCRVAACGDGYLNRAAGEQCELSADCSPGKTCQVLASTSFEDVARVSRRAG